MNPSKMAPIQQVREKRVNVLREVIFRPALFCCITAIVIAIQIFDRVVKNDAANQLQIDIAVTLQQDSLNFLDIVSKIIHFLAEDISVTVICILVITFPRDQLRMISMCTYIFTQVGILGIFNQVYSEPRPGWIQPQIQLKDCESAFGYPDISNCTCFLVMFICYREYIASMISKTYTKIVFYVILVMVQIGIIITNSYLGINSLHQSAGGLIIGIYLSVSYVIFFQHLIYKLYRLCNENSINQQSKSKLQLKKQRIYILVIMILVIVSLLTMSSLIYYFMKNHVHLQHQKYIFQKIFDKCTSNKSHLKKIQLDLWCISYLIQIGLVCIPSVCIGLVLRQTYYVENQVSYDPDQVEIQDSIFLEDMLKRYFIKISYFIGPPILYMVILTVLCWFVLNVYMRFFLTASFVVLFFIYYFTIYNSIMLHYNQIRFVDTQDMQGFYTSDSDKIQEQYEQMDQIL